MSRQRTIVILCGLLPSCGLLSETTAVDADEPDRNWPFYVPDQQSAPKPKNADRIRNGIDAFVLKRLEETELTLSPEASRRILMRRLYYNLIGLPPTPAEVDAFLNDKSPDAYEKVVDRLLDDVRYGERWARFWLDLARYADTAGYEGDPDLPHVWRYRDYVIDAFNNDKPYDLFIREQIAGDEFNEIMGAGDLPGTPPERIVAMTFLRLAPFTEPRGDETRHELLSEMTSTVSSVFLGLTVGCAKCHDHKYDNIPTRDFYRMKSFFSTIAIPRPEPGDGFQIGGPLSAGFYRPNEKQWASDRKAAFEREIGESKVAFEELTRRLTEKLGGYSGFGLQAHGGPLGNDYIYGSTPVNDGVMHVSIANGDGREWVFFTDDKGPEKTGSNAGANQGKWFGDIPNASHVALGQYSSGTGGIQTGGAHHVGEFAEILIYDRPLNEASRTKMAAYVSARYESKPETEPASAQPPTAGLQFWLDASDIDAQPETSNPANGQPVSRWVDRIGGITISQTERDRQPVMATVRPAGSSDDAPGRPAVRFDDDFLVGPLGEATFAKNQQGAIVVIYTARHTHEGYGFEVGGGGAFASTFINPGAARRSGLGAAINDPNNDAISDEERRQYRRLASRERMLKQQLKRLSPVAMSLRHSYGPPYEPGVPTSRVMIRGEYNNPGEVVEAGFLSCVTGDDKPAKIRLDPFKRWPTRSRRMALANWIASPRNPMTARVMVNRLWYRHFGQGIVKTPSDFGVLSGGPSHPELLDWLAIQFVKSKWSIKAMQRLIVTSSTWRQASNTTNAKAAQIDPENELLWRFNGRLLDAESIRDSILSFSGRLNPEHYGLPIFPPLPNDIEERVKYSNSKWDTQRGPEGRKRSIYIYQQRTLSMPMLRVFDAPVCDESRPRRRQSITPLQALALFNGELVHEESRYFADRVRKEAGTNIDKQITCAFRIVTSRQPDDDELSRLRTIMQQSESREQGLRSLCRALMNFNGFVYLD